MKSLKLVLVAIFVLAALALTACSEGVTDVTDDGLAQCEGISGNIYYWHNGQWELYNKGKVTVDLHKLLQVPPYMTQEQVDGIYEFDLGVNEDGYYFVSASAGALSFTSDTVYYDYGNGEMTIHLYLE